MMVNEFVAESKPRDGIASYERDEATVMTGMTYDDQGEPFDYIKQVMTAFDIAKTLEDQGVDAEVELLVADHFVSGNFIEFDQEPEMPPEKVEHYGNKRASYLEAIANIYSNDIPVSVEKTSELRDDNFEETVRALGDRVEKDENFAELLMGAVPDEAERPDATDRENTAYTREEIATIMATDTDIKVGPKREKKYDLPTQLDDVRQLRDFDPLTGVYVTNTYPVAMDEAKTHLSEEDWNEIQKFGITPYKAESKGLNPEDYRIMLTDGQEKLRHKLEKTPGELRFDLEAFKRMTRDPEQPPQADLASALEDEFTLIQEELSPTDNVK